MFSATLMNTNDTLSKYNIKKDSVSLSLFNSKLFESLIGYQKCYTVYWNAVPQVH